MDGVKNAGKRDEMEEGGALNIRFKSYFSAIID